MAETATPLAHTPTQRGPWAAFSRWRRSRPLVGALVLCLGAWFIMKPVIGATSMLLSLGVGGVSAYVIGAGMIIAALVSVVTPAQRHFPALMAVLLSLASLPLANLGGWIIGMLFGIIGSSMIFAWTPYTEAEVTKDRARRARRAARRAAARPAKSAAL